MLGCVQARPDSVQPVLPRFRFHGAPVDHHLRRLHPEPAAQLGAASAHPESGSPHESTSLADRRREGAQPDRVLADDAAGADESHSRAGVAPRQRRELGACGRVAAGGQRDILRSLPQPPVRPVQQLRLETCRGGRLACVEQFGDELGSLPGVEQVGPARRVGSPDGDALPQIEGDLVHVEADDVLVPERHPRHRAAVERLLPVVLRSPAVSDLVHSRAESLPLGARAEPLGVERHLTAEQVEGDPAAAGRTPSPERDGVPVSRVVPHPVDHVSLGRGAVDAHEAFAGRCVSGHHGDFRTLRLPPGVPVPSRLATLEVIDRDQGLHLTCGLPACGCRSGGGWLGRRRGPRGDRVELQAVEPDGAGVGLVRGAMDSQRRRSRLHCERRLEALPVGGALAPVGGESRARPEPLVVRANALDVDSCAGRAGVPEPHPSR